jgi:hypothetical protein
MVRISDELLSRPTALKDAEAYFANLEISSPSLFNMIANGAQELSGMPGACDIQFPSSLAPDATTDSTATQISPEAAMDPMDPIVPVDTDGTSCYYCIHCWKQHAREGRARDCANAFFNRAPHKCNGKCGDTSWYA